MNRKSNSIKYIFALLVAVFCSSANATYIVTSAPGVATGIGELEVGGTLYNVDFRSAEGQFDVFGGSEHFWMDEVSAFAALQAMATTLSDSGIFAVSSIVISVWFPGDGAAVAWICCQYPHWDLFIGTGYSDAGGVGGTAWSVANVPIPATAWLLGSAMVGLFRVARRKKRDVWGQSKN